MKFNKNLILSLLLCTSASALDIYPQVSGKILNIETVGKQVNIGDEIVKIDDRQAKLKLQLLQVIGKTKQQAFDDAQLNLNQTQELYDRMVASHRDLDIAKIDFDAKKHDLDAHNLKVKIQEIELEKYTIKSPLSGTIRATPNLRNTTNANAPEVLMVIEYINL